MNVRHAQDHMDQALRTLNFLVWGAQSNWWGLGCPNHCTSSSLPLLFTTFLLGTSLGILVSLLGFCYLGFGCIPPLPSLPLALWHLPRCTHGSRPTCMVEEEAVELALEF